MSTSNVLVNEILRLTQLHIDPDKDCTHNNIPDEYFLAKIEEDSEL